MKADIANLNVQTDEMTAEIDSYRHKVSLFDPHSLDPDILTEKARSFLSMSGAGTMLVMVDLA